MKRFIIEMIVCIVLISTGCMLSLFEIKDYRVVNAYTQLADESVQTYETTVDKNHILRIIMDTYVDIKYEIDDNLENTVFFDISQNLEYTYTDNRLKINDYRWYNLPFGEFIDMFMEGLKDKKIYYHEYRNTENEIVIRCSSKAKEYIRVSGD